MEKCDILFLEPVFKERIWGGQKLTTFGYNLPYDKTGECWAISAHQNGQSIIKNGIYKGKTLGEVYQLAPDLFGNIAYDTFPLLTKILDANDDLSVQVHPNDEYAQAYENDFGKTECWYVLDAEPHAYIIYGHHAQSKDEFKSMVLHHKFDQLLVKKEVKKGDFIYVPSGTIHALGKGLLILETQQSSDTTYRLYDYDRKDDKGNHRELHIDQSISVSTIPHQDYNVSPHTYQEQDAVLTTFIDNTFFNVHKLDVFGQYHMVNDFYKLVSVIDGTGMINGYSVKKGDHFIVTAHTKSLEINGNISMIVSSTPHH